MSDVRMPIITTRDGNKITKVCVEDIYKMINRVYGAINKAWNNSDEILRTVKKDTGDIYPEPYAGQLIIGTGVSKPCLGDAFDEQIGNNIAFMKAKLNANIKKHNILVKIWNELQVAIDSIDEELEKIDDYIILDLNGVRHHNPNYLNGLESKLGI